MNKERIIFHVIPEWEIRYKKSASKSDIQLLVKQLVQKLQYTIYEIRSEHFVLKQIKENYKNSDIIHGEFSLWPNCASEFAMCYYEGTLPSVETCLNSLPFYILPEPAYANPKK